MAKAAVFLVVGLLMAYTAGSELMSWLRARRRLRRTAGVVVGSTESDSAFRTGQAQHAPVFRFTTEDGEVVEAVSSGFSSRRPEVGRQVRVVYDPAHPRETVDRAGVVTAKLLLTPLLLVLGLGLAVFGLTLL